MKIRSKIVSALLLCSMLLSMAACSSSGSTDAANDTAANDTTAQAEETTVNPFAEVGLEEKNWDGREFRVVSRDSSYVAWESFDVFAESETGEPINDSVYKRNSIVEEKYGIVVKENKQPDLYNTISKMITAGENTMDAAVLRGTDGSNLATSKMLNDLYKVPNLDLEQPWWDQNAVKDFTINGKLFLGVSDLLYSDKDGSWVYTFNKNLAKNIGIEFPYQMAKDGTWTYEKFADLAKQASKDLNGDGVMNGEFDQYGITTEAYDTYAAFFYSGAKMFDSTKTGYPEYVLYSDRNVTAFDKYFELLVSQKDFYYSVGTKEREAFLDGRSLFRGTTLNAIRNHYREMEDDFGIVVAPKYDEAQENYAHIVSIGTSASVIVVPITAPDLDFTGYALQAISYESTDTLREAYLNVAFNGKYLRDEDSIEMLDLCIDSRVYDFSIIYTSWGGLFTAFYNVTADSKLDIASLHASVEASVNASIQQTVDLYKAMN